MNQDSLNFDFQLKAIFLFNPKAIPKMPKPSEQDQQDAKLIFYYPQNANSDEKRIQTGMAEGIYVFFDQFNAPSQIIDNAIDNKNQENEELKYQTIHLEMQTHIICKINSELFLFMTLSHPKIQKVKTITEDYYFSECNKFHYSLSKNLYTNVAENYINNFALFYGYDLTQLDQYTWRWLQCNSRNSQYLNLLYFQCFSFTYARVDHSIFLLLQFLLTIIRQIEVQISDFIVFYNGYFVYSTLPHKIALLLKEHYYGSGMPWQNQEQKIFQKFLPHEGSQLAYLNFNNLKNYSKETNFNAQYIYLNNKQKHLFTYLDKQFFVIMISDILTDFKNMHQVSLALKTNQDKIANKLENELALKTVDTTKFIYFNGMNLASKLSTQLNITKITAENLRVLQQVYEKLNTSNQYVVRCSGLWFYGTKVVDKKLICLLSVAISLSKIEEEVSKIIESTFPNLFL